MDKLNKHMKSDKAKWIVTFVALFLIIVMLGGVIAVFVTGAMPSEWFKKKDEPVTETNSSLEVEVENSPQLLLSQSESVAVTSETSRYLETTLTAMVLPEDATNKEVVWSIEWWREGGNEGDDVSEYWQIISTEKNNEVKIRLLQSASPSRVIVKTVDGGFTANATARYSQSIDYLNASNISYDRRFLNSENTVETSSGTSTLLDNGIYQVPLYCSEGLTIGNTQYDNQCLYRFTSSFYDFFGNKVNVADKYSDLFKEISLTMKINGVDISSSYFRKELNANGYIILTFIFKDGFKNVLGDISNYIDITFTNTRTNKLLLNMKLSFTIPVASVTLDQTEIVF